MAISRVEDTVRESQTTVLEIKHCIAEIPEVLGHYWEGGSTFRDRPIILNDMLGQRIQLPLHLCKTAKVCHICFSYHLDNDTVYPRTSKVSCAFIIKAKPDIASSFRESTIFRQSPAGTHYRLAIGWFVRVPSLT